MVRIGKGFFFWLGPFSERVDSDQCTDSTGDVADHVHSKN